MNKEYTMPTEGQIAKWKKQHGALHKLTVKVPGQTAAICIVRAPKVSDISQSSTLGESDEYKIGMIQLNNCWLHGDERIRTQLAFSQSAAKEMGRIFQVYPWDVESVTVDQDMITKLKAHGLDPLILGKINEAGILRQITISIGARPVIVDGIDTREKLSASFMMPDLEIFEKSKAVPDFLDQGTILINECFVEGDERFKDHSDEHIAFAAFMAGHSLLEKFTTEVEKL